MARRRSAVADFFEGFNLGYGTVGKVMQDRELRKIASETPEVSQGFTAEQGAELDAAAKSGQYDIGYDQERKAYTVTPKADPSQTGLISQQGVTDFMGKRTAGAMNEAQINNARQRAMAGVLMKSDPVTGVRLMREVSQGERDDERYGWEKQRNERQIRLDKEVDDEKNILQQLDAEAGEWFKSRLKNPDGTEREATPEDHAAASQFRASRLVQAGRIKEAAQAVKEYGEFAMKQIQLQEAQRNQALTQAAASLAAGDLEPLKEFYNRFTPDGAQVTNVSRREGGEIVIERATDDGRALPPTVMKDTGQTLAILNTFKDPMALYNWSQNEFRNNLAVKADKRADRADARDGARLGLAQAKDAREQQEQKEDRETRAALYKERNPEATPAQLAAVRRGILSPTGETEGITSDYKPDSFGAGGKAVQKDKRGNIVVTEIKPDGTQGKTVTIRAPGATAAPTEKPDKATAYEQAKAAVAKGADKAKVNERLKKMGYDPLNDW